MLHLAIVVETGADSPHKVTTRSVRWRREATALDSAMGTTELKQAFQTLVNEERLAGTVVRIALNGELCVTRVITGTSDHVRRQLAEQEDRSQLYLSLGPGRKAQATSVREIDARHQQALLTVANQRTLNVLVQVAEAVGIQIGCIEPSLVAMARAHGQLRERSDNPCLVIQVDERAAELGICHQGNLLLEYHPAGRAAAAVLPDILAQHLNRLQRHVDRYHPGIGSQLQEVYLCGAAGPVALARKKFEEQAALQVHVLEPEGLRTDWQYDGKPPGTDFTPVLGSALADIGPNTIAYGPNLMDHVLKEARLPMRPFLLRSAVPLAAVLLIALALALGNLVQHRSLTGMRAELESLAPTRSRAALLRLQLGATEVKLDQLRRLEQTLSKPNWATLIERIGQSMPADVWLERFGVADSQTGRLTGVSYSDSGVNDFVDHLERVPDVRRVALEGTGPGSSFGGAVTSFDLAFLLAGTDDAETGGGRDD